MIAAIDVGSGYVKAISSGSKDGPVSFPSQVGVVGVNTLNQYGMESMPVIEYSGRTWVTGADAGRVIPDHKQSNTLDFGWSGSDGWMVLLIRALANMGIMSGSHRIVVGVPQRVYAEKRAEMIGKLTGRHLAVVDGQRFDVNILPGSPMVMPQAAAAIYRLVELNPEMFKHMIGAVDVGTYTTGFAVMEGTNVVPYLSGGVEIGVSGVAKALGRLIHEEYGTHQNAVALMRAVNDKQMFLNNEVTDLTKMVADAADEVVGPLVSQLHSIWDQHAASMVIAIVGGGAPLFEKAIRRGFPYANSPPADKGRHYPVLGMYGALKAQVAAEQGLGQGVV